ncbi:MAG: VWA domain-containing protein [Hyphomicrobium zavarzinii]|jgi:Flp pilus assembly protein TadG|uniref:vWA domain-containing protein n=1 Tax=Hyphomicrobium zavarzinii TaxID=48292 RepID=UPI001A585FAE|nr:pilus assembly protein TadG-related protein [Hyphomicrobium zavarzinii]MBL8844911.1 VWA domain-containing protein [Hyphomicrobium zavarzinii]
MRGWLIEKTRSFKGDEQGSVAVIFSMMLVVLVFAAGIAVDYGRTLHARSTLISAADAAALAAGRALGEGTRTDGELKALAETYFKENIGDGMTFGDVTDFAVSIDRQSGKVRVDASANIPMTLTRVAGFDTIEVPATAETISSQRDIELALVLDVTGSMGSPSSKIADLRTAAADLVELMLPDEGRPGKVRIGLAPYAASLNAGSYFKTVTGRSSGTGCVFERSGSARFSESAPGTGAYLGYNKDVECPSATVQALTDRKATLKSQIAALRPNGNTAGHIGTAWGWYLLSPRWSGVWPSASKPAAYDPKTTIKAVLLMTDGEFNTEYVAANGSSSAQARALCTNMKAQGVVVYAVGFMAGRTAEKLLSECATSANHYFSASDGDALKMAFQSVGRSLTDLHLTQ